ncbi:hypothetical protein LY76DRAFT_271399 [Colletotrichum caudatum]|nr:hypothetical protein LY76DRAFT_271399 [Colletotrichum caudatum]
MLDSFILDPRPFSRPSRPWYAVHGNQQAVTRPPLPPLLSPAQGPAPRLQARGEPVAGPPLPVLWINEYQLLSGPRARLGRSIGHIVPSSLAHTMQMCRRRASPATIMVFFTHQPLRWVAADRSICLSAFRTNIKTPNDESIKYKCPSTEYVGEFWHKAQAKPGGREVNAVIQ